MGSTLEHDIFLGQAAERVSISKIRQEMEDYQPKLNSYQIGRSARELGFEVRTAGGKQWVYTGSVEKLAAVAVQLDIEDDDLTEAAGNIQA